MYPCLNFEDDLQTPFSTRVFPLLLYLLMFLSFWLKTVFCEDSSNRKYYKTFTKSTKELILHYFIEKNHPILVQPNDTGR